MAAKVRVTLPALLPLFLLLPGLSRVDAQEPVAPPQPDPAPEVVRDRMPPEGRFELITTRRARLGVVVDLQENQADSIGALIQSVTPNGPAARAGIRSGDVITRFNGHLLVARSLHMRGERSAPGVALTVLSAGLKPGDTVVVQYLRKGIRRNATVVAGDEPAWTWSGPDVPGGVFLQTPEPESLSDADRTFTMRVFADSMLARRSLPMRTPVPRMFLLGSPLAYLELAPLNPELGRYFGTAEGVLVINVPDDTRLRLRPGDVVLSVDGRRIESPPQLLRVLQSYEPDEPVHLELMRMKRKEVVVGSVGAGER